MGFRDDYEAADARAAAAERAAAELREENEELRAQMAELRARLEAKEKPPPKPLPPVLGTATDEEIARSLKTAYKAVWPLGALAILFVLVAWAGHYGIVPAALSGAVPILLYVLGGAFLVTTVVALWLAGKPIRQGSGYDNNMMIFVTWFWVPFVLLMPVVGTIMGIVRVVVLFRGRFGAATVTSGGSSTSYEARRLTRQEGWPAAIVFLFLTLGWPAMLASGSATNMGASRTPGPDDLSGPTQWHAVVSAVDGDPRVSVGQECTVLVTPSWGPYNCQIQVDCGGVRLYGGGSYGYTRCTVQGGQPMSAHDPRDTAEEGDPRLLLNVPARQVEISDSAPQRRSVTLTLN